MKDFLEAVLEVFLETIVSEMAATTTLLGNLAVTLWHLVELHS